MTTINRKELTTAIQAAITLRENLIIVGLPGTGKTQITKQVVENITDYYDIWHPVISNPTDFRGFPSIINNLAEFVPFGNLRRIINHESTEPFIVIIDDLIQASTAVKAALMQVVEERRIGEHIISPNVTFLMLTNDVTHRAGGTGMIEPLKSRATIYNFQLTSEEWIRWARANSIRSTVPSYIRFRPEALNDFKPSSDFKQSPCPRTWEKLARTLDVLDSNASTNLRFAAAEGLIGPYASEFIAFEQMASKLPDPKKVLKDPSIFTHSEDDPSVTYALTGAVAALTTADNMPKIIAFADTIPESYGVNLISDAITVCPEAVETTAFEDWSLENADLYGDFVE